MSDTVPLKIAGKPCQLQLHQAHVIERLRGLGYTSTVNFHWTHGMTPGEYVQEEDGTDTIYLNPHFVILLRMGMVPLPWPTALCLPAFFRKRLLQTLAHELRHALQCAGLTDVKDKEPWLSYPTLKWMGRGYVLVALAGTVLVQRLLTAENLTGSLIVGGVLLALGLTYMLLAYLNYHLDPLEVDARAYERSQWQLWADCLETREG